MTANVKLSDSRRLKSDFVKVTFRFDVPLLPLLIFLYEKSKAYANCHQRNCCGWRDFRFQSEKIRILNIASCRSTVPGAPFVCALTAYNSIFGISTMASGLYTPASAGIGATACPSTVSILQCYTINAIPFGKTVYFNQ